MHGCVAPAQVHHREREARSSDEVRRLKARVQTFDEDDLTAKNDEMRSVGQSQTPRVLRRMSDLTTTSDGGSTATASPVDHGSLSTPGSGESTSHT